MQTGAGTARRKPADLALSFSSPVFIFHENRRTSVLGKQAKVSCVYQAVAQKNAFQRLSCRKSIHCPALPENTHEYIELEQSWVHGRDGITNQNAKISSISGVSVMSETSCPEVRMIATSLLRVSGFSRVKAMYFPSGDQIGQSSFSGVFVRCFNPAPSTPTVQISFW